MDKTVFVQVTQIVRILLVGATNLEFGITGVIDNYQSPFGSNSNNNGFDTTRDIGVYARITIPLDKPKERINCNSLYELELRKKRLEVLKLQQELEALKRLNASGNQNSFENQEIKNVR